MRVLLIKPSSFGDVIHTLPMAHALRHHPGVEALDWVVNSEYKPLLEENPDVTRLLTFPRRQVLGRSFLNFLSELRRESYDWVIDFQGLLRSGVMTKLARGKRKIGMGDSREGARFFYSEVFPITACHAIERYGQVLHHLNVKYDPLIFPLPKPIEKQDVPHSFILIHPSSRWPTKSLPEKLVADLVNQLSPQPVVIVGQGKAWNLPGVIDLTNRTNLKELLGLIQKAEAVISTDSGPMHVAAALHKPLVALFGPTSSIKTGPWTENSRVLQLSLPCVPCFSRTCHIAETQACLKQMTTHAILEALNQVLH